MELELMFLKNFMKKFDKVPFEMVFWNDEKISVGEGEPQFKVKLLKPIEKKEILNSTSLAFGEAFMDGNLQFEGDMFFILDTFMSQIDNFSTNFRALPHIFHKCTNKSKQKEEVTSHYDIGNDFYSLWLDKTMSYSCAYFEDDTNTLEEAQMNKINYILKKLNLSEGMSLLDIGCGWGTLLIEAAKKYKVKGLGITLSSEQYKSFSERIKEENLEDYIEVRLMDYRDLKKSNLLFDRVVSVGMIEHVGRANYDLFFENVDEVLKDKGLFLLHYISNLIETKGDAWIRKYIFPGGMIPSFREIIDISADYNYHTIDVESLRPHYTKTLLKWYSNFNNNIETIRQMFGERFVRMWALYLCSCAASFNNGVIDLHQILFTKGINNNLPSTRKYMY
ncbi:MAG: cyclopropane-fatty-acyl-phospholipid synthase family protein [Clostridium sp.]|nr:cyclopropane-fatty-acyl-phospholipid synthase family protein [Clostridium sp.]